MWGRKTVVDYPNGFMLEEHSDSRRNVVCIFQQAAEVVYEASP